MGFGGMGGGGPTGLTGGGGPLGMMGMDIAPYKMPVIGGFFQDPNELFQKEQSHQMAKAFHGYRPELVQARLNMIRAGLSPYQGANNMLSSMMGGTGGLDPNQLYQSPLSARALQLGAPSDMGPKKRGGAGGGGLLGGLLGGGGGGGLLGGLLGGGGGSLGGLLGGLL
jgi:hypothetical protein